MLLTELILTHIICVFPCHRLLVYLLLKGGSRIFIDNALQWSFPVIAHVVHPKARQRLLSVHKVLTLKKIFKKKERKKESLYSVSTWSRMFIVNMPFICLGVAEMWWFDWYIFVHDTNRCRVTCTYDPVVVFCTDCGSVILTHVFVCVHVCMHVWFRCCRLVSWDLNCLHKVTNYTSTTPTTSCGHCHCHFQLALSPPPPPQRRCSLNSV